MYIAHWETHAAQNVFMASAPLFLFMADITFNTDRYKDVHGKAPHSKTRGNWLFAVPPQLGKRPYLFNNMTYGDAKKMIAEKVHETQLHGEFVLQP